MKALVNGWVSLTHRFTLLALCFLTAKMTYAFSVSNEFKTSPSDPKNVILSEITEHEAIQLIQSLSKDKYVTYPFPEGCFARATAMAQIAEKKNIVVGKVFAEGTLAIAPRGKYKHITWQYHVAPVVAVSQKDGSAKIMVLDPYLSRKPIPVEKWTNLLKYDKYKECLDDEETLCEKLIPKIEKVYYGSRFQYLPINSQLKSNNRAYRNAFDPYDLKHMHTVFEVFDQFPKGNFDIEEVERRVSYNPEHEVKPSTKKAEGEQ